jgi:hypothetical protein
VNGPALVDAEGIGGSGQRVNLSVSTSERETKAEETKCNQVGGGRVMLNIKEVLQRHRRPQAHHGRRHDCTAGADGVHARQQPRAALSETQDRRGPRVRPGGVGVGVVKIEGRQLAKVGTPRIKLLEGEPDVRKRLDTHGGWAIKIKIREQKCEWREGGGEEAKRGEKNFGVSAGGSKMVRNSYAVPWGF